MYENSIKSNHKMSQKGFTILDLKDLKNVRIDENTGNAYVTFTEGFTGNGIGCEFKETPNSLKFRKVLETICAFLNTLSDGIITNHPYAYIYIGIKDDGEIVGLPLTAADSGFNKMIDQINLEYVDHILLNNMIVKTNGEPMVYSSLTSRIVETYDGKQVFVLVIHESGSKSKYMLRDTKKSYIRLGGASNMCINTEVKCEVESKYLNIIANISNQYKLMEDIMREKYEGLLLSIQWQTIENMKDREDLSDKSMEYAIQLLESNKKVMETQQKEINSLRTSVGNTSKLCRDILLVQEDLNICKKQNNDLCNESVLLKKRILDLEQENKRLREENAKSGIRKMFGF